MEISIVGTGVAALLLAQSLIRQSTEWHISLFGPNTKQHPHVLSVWSDSDTPFDHYCVGHWQQLSFVTSEGRELVLPLERQTYRTFRAQAWADGVMAELTKSGQVSFVPEHVVSVEHHSTRPAVVTAADRVEADWVFSSVGSGATPRKIQRFAGFEFELPAPHDSPIPRFLDFRTRQDNDFRFIYTLPLGERRLFVEHVSYQPCNHNAAIERYLTEVLGITSWRVLDQERGATPLFRELPPRKRGSVIHIGIDAGLAKPATGYAVMRMWRDAEHLAQSLARWGEPEPDARKRSLQSLADRYFLDLLERDPGRLPHLLSTLIGKARGDAVLSFLDDRANVVDQLRVAVAMPEWLRWWASDARLRTK